MIFALWLLGCSADDTPAAPAPAPVERPARPARPEAEPNSPTVVIPAVRNPAFVDARCNDGSPFAFGFRKGSGTGAKTWVIYVEGGFWCDDGLAPCGGRTPALTTGLRRGKAGPPLHDGDPWAWRQRGVVSADPAENPTFADANQIFAHYCSSDLWLGDSTELTPTTGSPTGWFFSGRRNLAGLFDALPGLGFDDADPATQVLLVGSSAGGLGLVANADAVAGWMPQTVAGKRARLALDGAWLVAPPTPVQLPKVDKWGPLHPRCVAAHPDAPESCIYAKTWWPYLHDTWPVFVQLSAQDGPQVSVMKLRGDTLAAWQRDVRASFVGVDWVFSGGEAYHITLGSPEFTTLGPPGGPTLSEDLTAFWKGEPPKQVIWGW